MSNILNYEIFTQINTIKEEQEKKRNLKYTIMKYSTKSEKDKFNTIKEECDEFLKYFNDNNSNIRWLLSSVYMDLKRL